MKKRVCSILLVLALLLGLVPNVALATDENENVALNATVLGVSKEPPNEKEHAKYALDGNPVYTKWCAIAPTGWMVFQTKEAVKPAGMMVYHAGYGAETVKNNIKEYQLEVLNSKYISEANFLKLNEQEQREIMMTQYYWTSVIDPVIDNWNHSRYHNINMPEARSVFRFNVTAAGIDDVIRVYELELLTHALVPESIGLDPIMMQTEETVVLCPYFYPNYFVEPVTYSVDDTDIVECVDGTLIGKRPGTTTITVTAVHYPELQTTAEVTVTKQPCREYQDHTALWWEEFERESLPEGWTVEDHDGDGRTWEICTDRVHHGEQAMVSRPSADSKDYASDNWLITPEFLVGHQYIFEVMAYVPKDQYAEEIRFYALEEGKEPKELGNAVFLIAAGAWLRRDISLADYEGRQIRLAVSHPSNSANSALYVDCAALWRPNLEQHTSHVTFKVEHGTWDGQDRSDKIVDVELIDGCGTLPKDSVPTNMQPDPGYEKGSWDRTPIVEENGVVGDIVYTYTFDEKPKDYATVTFQVVKGTIVEPRASEDSRQVTVKFTNGKGTLSPEDVPEPFEMIPTEGYGFGSWEVLPDTEKDAITQDVTYRYIFTPAREMPGQVPIFWEGFEGDSLPEGWTVEDHDGDGRCWEIYTDKVHHGQQAVISNPSPTAEDFVPDNWLITPEFLVGYQYYFSMMYSSIESQSGTADFEDAPYFKAYILEEGKEPLDFTQGITIVNSTNWVPQDYNLSAFEGRRIRIAIAHYFGSTERPVILDCAALWRSDLENHTANVTFKIEHGTWDGQDQADKVVEVELQNGYGTLPESAVPTNMQPDPGYEKGTWNRTPIVDENGVVGDIVYTYTFAEKPAPKDHATVTFRVVNGIFAEEPLRDPRQVTVKLTNGKGTLSPEDVPDPSEMIATLGYGLGAWDVTPNTEKDAITQDVTYQYVFVPVVRVEINVSGCTWADGKHNPITYTFPQGDGPVYLAEEQVPTGMIPDEYHLPEGGAWYRNGVPMKRIDNILEYPIQNNTEFYYIFEGKHIILPERTLLLLGTDIEVKVQKDLGELTCDDPSVEIEHLYDKPDFSLYGVTIPDVPKTYTFTALDPTDGNKEITAQVQVLAESPFSDVKKHHWFCDAVLWAVENGITDGFPDGTFKPNADCTRAQIVTFLWRSEGSPEPQCTESPFTDVDSDDWFYKAVLWAVENKITDGFPDGSFKPKDSCTRAQAVTFLYRLYGFELEDMPWEDMENVFPDVKKEWYYEAVMWAAYTETVGGFPDGTFRPKEICTRAQIVTLLYRIF